MPSFRFKDTPEDQAFAHRLISAMKENHHEQKGFKLGDQVLYVPTQEKGFVKGFNYFGGVFVVFASNATPDNFQRFSGALCQQKDLEML